MLKTDANAIVMEKQNKVYKLRRSVQKLTGRVLGPVFTTKVMYRIAKKENIDLKNPKTFSEKICWYKLNYCPKSKLIIECADKYNVRKYAASKGLQDHLTTLLGVWDNADDIEWENLPEKFALKCTHGCAYIIIVLNKNGLNIEEAKKTIAHWLKDDFGYYNGEPHYNLGKRRIICEEYIDAEDRLPVDYKIHCVNGTPKVIQECYDRTNGKALHHFYDVNGNPLNIGKDETNSKLSIDENVLQELISLSGILAEDFPYVRVDCYIHKNKIKLGELTFSPGAGILGSLSEYGELEMGRILDLSGCMNK